MAAPPVKKASLISSCNSFFTIDLSVLLAFFMNNSG